MSDLDRITLVIESLPGNRAQVSTNIHTPTPGMRLETPAHALAIDALGWLGKQECVAGFVYALVEPMTRYCPGCGSIGPVDARYRDCCPDGSQARVIPQSLAEKCRDTFRLVVDAAPPAEGAPADPMDWPLPCDVTVGHGTMRKGVKLRTLVLGMKDLYQRATGNDADEVAARTPEQRAQQWLAVQTRIERATTAAQAGNGAAA